MSQQRVSLAVRQEFVLLANQAQIAMRTLCHRYGMSAKTGYQWLKRFRAGGLDALAERGHRPHRSPRRTAAALEEVIVAVRDDHPAWGGRKIRAYLQAQGLTALPSASTMTAILRRHQRLSVAEGHPHQPWRRDEQDRLPLREVAAPALGLDELEARIAASERALAETRGRLGTLIAQAPLLRASQLHFLNARRLARARAALSGDERIACLQGFCPAARLAELNRRAAENGWGLVVAEPEDDDPTPTLLRNSRFTALFQPVMDFLRVLPGYREFDASGLFLIFFALFFAMILGDAGYGLLLLATTFVASRCFPAIPRRTLPLFYLLSAATVIWGAMSGLWFGVPQLAELPGLRGLVVPSLNAFVADNEATLIWLCLTLGAVHLTLAHLWAAWRHRSLQSLADLGWMLVVWAAYVAAVWVLVGDGRLSVAIILAAGGLVGVVLFGEQTGVSFVRGVGRGLLNLPLNLLTAISSFSDMVSYLRLFAIGLATKEVAVAFNQLALEVGFDGVVAALGAALLVVLGHSVNLLLGALGVIVHGLRLNLLEFSRHLNVTWSGIPYEPFRLLTASDLDHERHPTSR